MSDDRDRSAIGDAFGLARHVHGLWPRVALMVALGFGAALAEAFGIGLAVLLLFTLIGREAPSEGLLGRLSEILTGSIGTAPATVALAFAALILAMAALAFSYQLITAVVMNTVSERMRGLVHRAFVRLSYQDMQRRGHGALWHTLGTGTWQVADAIHALARMGIGLMAVAVFGTALLALSPLIGLTAAIGAAAMFGAVRLLALVVRRLSDRTLRANRVLAERMAASLDGMRMLRVFSQEERFLRLFDDASAEVKRLAIRTERIKSLIGPVGEVLGLATLIAIALVAGGAGIDTATTVTAVLLLFRLQPHMREIEGNRMALAGMGAVLADVCRTLDPDDKIWPVEGRAEFPGLAREIRFEDVRFTHDPERGPALSGVSLAIPAGRTTLIAGPSGSGKTTVLNLLLRLYEPEAGRILADGRPVSDFTRESWLRDIAIAGQDVELLAGTIAENLSLDREIAPAELARICGLVEILEDIEALPHGFDTPVGASGLSFSGGQRQRLGLARALLRRPRILILDEAMSALEPDREARIRARIQTELPGLTLVVVSHRRDASVGADTVVPLAKGRIAAAALSAAAP